MQDGERVFERRRNPYEEEAMQGDIATYPPGNEQNLGDDEERDPRNTRVTFSAETEAKDEEHQRQICPGCNHHVHQYVILME
jgi:hypothetical protein